MARLRLTGRISTLGLVAATLLTFVLCSSAQANLIFNLTVANPNLASQGPGPYAQVDISGGGTSYSVTVTGLNNFVLGDGGVFALNLSAAAGAGTLTAITGFTQVAKGGNEDGFGDFNFKINDGSGFSSPYTSFTLGFTTANAVTLATLLTANEQGAFGGGHLALATNTTCTGFAANAGNSSESAPDNSACTTAVPEPATLFLVGTGLVSFGFFSRKRWAKGLRTT